MNSKSLRARIGYRLLAVFVSVAVIISMMPAAGLSGTDVYGAEGGLKIETPELAVTGTDVIGGKTYTADNIDQRIQGIPPEPCLSHLLHTRSSSCSNTEKSSCSRSVRSLRYKYPIRASRPVAV